jgi:hypothetical protein
MADSEIRDILSTGFSKLSLQADDGVLDQVPLLTGGYPHYAHLLGYCAVKACVENETSKLTQELFTIACNFAVEDAIEKYRDAFAVATATTQASRYPLILSACGYARADSRGVFRATDVADAVRDVFNIDLAVQAVVPALGEFLSGKRLEVLESVRVGGRVCYRFVDPMMRPFCRLKARDLLRPGGAR